MKVPKPLIQLRQVVKVYETAAGDFPALRGISADISPGEFLGVIGKSGAGKSTLLNMITGVDHLTSGEVIVRSEDGDVSVHNLSENELALWRGRNMGVVYQSFQLLPMLTLVENIMLPMDLCGLYHRGESRERALELLRIVELEEQAFKLPNSISGGQQQRVAIARALANDPPILVADEPTGSLDSVTADHVFEVFEHLVEKGKTILMVTHDNSLAPRFSRYLRIQDGEIVLDPSTGSPVPACPACTCGAGTGGGQARAALAQAGQRRSTEPLRPERSASKGSRRGVQAGSKKREQ